METITKLEALKYIEQNASKHKLSRLCVGADYLDREHTKLNSIFFLSGNVINTEIELCEYLNVPCFKIKGLLPAYMELNAKYTSVRIWGCGTSYYFYLTKENLDALMEYVRITLTFK